jgi:hypothetical protein
MWLPWLLRAPYRLTGPHEVGLRDFQFLDNQSGAGKAAQLSPETVRIFQSPGCAESVSGMVSWGSPRERTRGLCQPVVIFSLVDQHSLDLHHTYIRT